MFALAWSSVRGHFVRFALTAFAVSLGVAFITGTSSLSTAMNDTFNKMIGDTSAGTDAYVRAEGAGAGFDFDQTTIATLPLDFADDLEEADGVREALANIGGPALLVGEDGTAVRRGNAPALGFPITPDDPVSTIVDGRAPETAGEIAVEVATLEDSGYVIGDEAEIVVGAERETVTIVGSAETGSTAGASVLLFEPERASELFAPDGTTDAFIIRGDGDATQTELVDAIAPILPEDFEVITGEAYVEESTAEVREGLSFFTVFLTVFALVALLVGAFIITNTFLMLLSQRTRELAMLRAIGTRKRQVLTMVLTEALAIGLLGSALGFGLGLVITVGLMAMMNAFGLDMPLSPPITASAIISAFGTGTLVTVLAAVIPAIKASRTAPVAAMSAGAVAQRTPLRGRFIAAVVLLAAAGALAAWALANEENMLYKAGAAAGVALVGVLVVSAPAAGPIVGLLAAPFARGAVGGLAADNTVRNPRRTALTASALTIGLALVACVGILAESATRSTQSALDSQLTADFIVSAGFEGIPVDLPEKLREVDGVAEVVAAENLNLALPDEDEPVRATYVDAEAFAQAFATPMVAGELRNPGRDEALISEDFADTNNLAVGDAFTATPGVLAEQDFTVVGVYESADQLGDVLTAVDLGLEATPEQARSTFAAYVTVEPGADAAKVKERIDSQVVAPLLTVATQTAEEFSEATTGNLNQLLTIVYGLLGLSILIAGLGIANTLAMGLFERTREIGMLRAIGLKRGQLARMVVAESVWTALFGAILGVVLGLGVGVLLQRALADEGLVTLGIPWPTLAAVVIGAAIIGVVAALLPALRATRINVLQAIAAE